MASVELTGLDGKVAVVTGAGRMRSIGRSIAVELARAGCDVVVTGSGRDPSRYPDDEKAVGWRDVDSVADEIRAMGRRSLPVAIDIRDADAVEALAAQTIAEFGRIDVVVNNAGSARGGDRANVTDVPLEDWHRVLNTNLNGPLYMCRAFGKYMVEQGDGGSIINISSIGGKMMLPMNSPYAASKAGLNAMTACMAREVGKDGIRVNAICPGLVDTARMADLARRGDDDEEASKSVPVGAVGFGFDDFIDAHIPLGRAGVGNDIAYMAVFLASDQGSWITGQCYNVDGGSVVEH